MNAIQTLSSILGLSFASGVNLYASILMVGLGVRFGWIHGLPGDLDTLANPIILTAAGVLYFLEFFADKIPYVSVAWDTIHTIIRPLGGAALALASTSKMSPEIQALAVLAGGSVALGSHSTKMGYRLLAHASPEPVSDTVFSFAEDFGVAGLVLLTYQHPEIAIGVVTVLLIGIAIVLPAILRVIAFFGHGIFGRVASWFQSQPSVERPPDWLDRNLYPEVVRCYARRISKVPWMKQGFLVSPTATQPNWQFAYKSLLGAKMIMLESGQLTESRGLIYDSIGTGPWSLYFTKDCRSPIDRAAAETAPALPQV